MASFQRISSASRFLPGPNVMETSKGKIDNDESQNRVQQTARKSDEQIYVKVSLLQKEDSHIVLLVNGNTSILEFREFLCNRENWQFLSDPCNFCVEKTSNIHSTQSDTKASRTEHSKEEIQPTLRTNSRRTEDKKCDPQSIMSSCPPEAVRPVSHSPNFFTDLRSFIDLATPWEKDGEVVSSEFSSSSDWDMFTETKGDALQSSNLSDWDTTSSDKPDAILETSFSSFDSSSVSREKANSETDTDSWSSETPSPQNFEKTKTPTTKSERVQSARNIFSPRNRPPKDKDRICETQNGTKTRGKKDPELKSPGRAFPDTRPHNMNSKQDFPEKDGKCHSRKPSNMTKAILESICIAREKYDDNNTHGKSDYIPLNLTTTSTVREILYGYESTHPNTIDLPLKLSLYLSIEVQGERRAAWDEVISLDREIVDYLAYLLSSPVLAHPGTGKAGVMTPLTGVTIASRGSSGVLSVGSSTGAWNTDAPKGSPYSPLLTQLSVREITKKLREMVSPFTSQITK